jgi:hypothetical protein
VLRLDAVPEANRFDVNAACRRRRTASSQA